MAYAQLAPGGGSFSGNTYGTIVAPSSGGTGVSATQLVGLRQCIGNVKAQTANCTVASLGDSVFFGQNSATTATPQRITYFLAKELQGIPGVYANDASFCGFGGGGLSRLTTDTRITGSTGMSTTAITYGGTLAQFGNTSASLVYQPGVASGASPSFSWDTVTVLFYGGSGTGAVQATGGTLVSAALNATGFTSITAVAGSASASNTVTMTMPTGANAYVECVQPYLSTQKSINIIDSGYNGATLPTIITPSTYGLASVFAVIQPNVTLSLLGKNDWYYATPLATFNADLVYAAGIAQTYGTFVLGADMPDSVNQNTQSSYVSAMQAEAVANNWAYVDFWTRWGGVNAYSALLAAGWYSYTNHPSVFGYSDLADGFFKLMTGY